MRLEILCIHILGYYYQEYNNLVNMGNEPPKPVKKVTLEDTIIDMKIQSKGVMRAAKKAEKES